MTNDMLRLARAVYPSSEWFWDLDDKCPWRYVGGIGVNFDPANNADQAWNVLAWLTGGDNAQYAAADFRDRYLRVWNRTNPGYFEIDHDGTASGIRRAVVEAAMRVAK